MADKPVVQKEIVHWVDDVGGCVEVEVEAEVEALGSEEGRLIINGIEVAYSHAKALGTWHWPALDD